MSPDPVLQLKWVETYFQAMEDPNDRLPARGYALMDEHGQELLYTRLPEHGFLVFPLERDDLISTTLSQQAFDPGRLVVLSADPSSRPFPQVKVRDASGELLMGRLGIADSGGGDGRQLLSRMASERMAGLVLLEILLNGKRVDIRILVGSKTAIEGLRASLEAAE